MIRRDDNLREVKQLTELACEGQLSPQQARQLDELVCSDDQVAWYFTRYMAMHAMLERYELHSLQGTHEQQEDESAGPMPPDEITLADLAALDAPDEALKLVDVTAQLQLEEAVRRAKEAERAAAYARQARRLGLVKDDTKTRSRIIIPTPVFYGGIAALLAVGLWVGWIAVSSMIGEEPKDFSETTPQPSEPEQAVVVERPVVATLIRTLDAVWAERHVEVRKGERHEAAPLAGGAELREGDKYTLEQGLAQLDTKRGAIVVLEAPCHVELLGENQIRLTRGKLVGRCPTDESKGFVVDTPNARVVDVGTEFGVQVAESGESEAYVFDGEIELLPTVGRQSPSSGLIVEAGQVIRVNSVGQTMRSVDFRDLVFVRTDEFDANVKARAGSAYHQWIVHSYALRRDPDVVLYFTFDGQAESDRHVINRAGDSSVGAGIVNGARWDKGRFPNDKRALALDGDDSVAVNLPQAYEAVTLAGWFYIDRFDNTVNALFDSDDWTLKDGLHWQLYRSDYMIGIDKGMSRSQQEQLIKAPIGFNQSITERWIHFAVVINTAKKSTQLYVDGERVGYGSLHDALPVRIRQACLGNWNNVAGLTLGDNERGLVGRIDEFVILRRAVSENEIKNLCQGLWNQNEQ